MSGLPAFVDTEVSVAARRPSEPGGRGGRRLLGAIDAGEVAATVPTIPLAELRAGLTARLAEAAWPPLVGHLLESDRDRVEPVYVGIAELAVELRQETRLTLPDALIVATGIRPGWDRLFSLDRDLDGFSTGYRSTRPSNGTSIERGLACLLRRAASGLRNPPPGQGRTAARIGVTVRSGPGGWWDPRELPTAISGVLGEGYGWYQSQSV